MVSVFSPTQMGPHSTAELSMQGPWKKGLEKCVLQKMLKEYITQLVTDSLHFENKFSVEALVGVTLDDHRVLLLSIDETVRLARNIGKNVQVGTTSHVTPAPMSQPQATILSPSGNSLTPVNSVLVPSLAQQLPSANRLPSANQVPSANLNNVVVLPNNVNALLPQSGPIVLGSQSVQTPVPQLCQSILSCPQPVPVSTTTGEVQTGLQSVQVLNVTGSAHGVHSDTDATTLPTVLQNPVEGYQHQNQASTPVTDKSVVTHAVVSGKVTSPASVVQKEMPRPASSSATQKDSPRVTASHESPTHTPGKLPKGSGSDNVSTYAKRYPDIAPKPLPAVKFRIVGSDGVLLQNAIQLQAPGQPVNGVSLQGNVTGPGAVLIPTPPVFTMAISTATTSVTSASTSVAMLATQSSLTTHSHKPKGTSTGTHSATKTTPVASSDQMPEPKRVARLPQSAKKRKRRKAHAIMDFPKGKRKRGRPRKHPIREPPTPGDSNSQSSGPSAALGLSLLQVKEEPEALLHWGEDPGPYGDYTDSGNFFPPDETYKDAVKGEADDQPQPDYLDGMSVADMVSADSDLEESDDPDNDDCNEDPDYRP